MKKIIIILVLALAFVAPIFASSSFGIGAEIGYPSSGVTFNFDFNEKWDGYATVRFNYKYPFSTGLQFVLGGQYKIAEILLENSNPININFGFQGSPSLFFVRGGGGTAFILEALATIGLSYDFEDFPGTIYFRGGLGLDMAFNESVITLLFAHNEAIGFVYHF